MALKLQRKDTSYLSLATGCPLLGPGINPVFGPSSFASLGYPRFAFFNYLAGAFPLPIKLCTRTRAAGVIDITRRQRHKPLFNPYLKGFSGRAFPLPLLNCGGTVHIMLAVVFVQ